MAFTDRDKAKLEIILEKGQASSLDIVALFDMREVDQLIWISDQYDALVTDKDVLNELKRERDSASSKNTRLSDLVTDIEGP